MAEIPPAAPPPAPSAPSRVGSAARSAASTPASMPRARELGVRASLIAPMLAEYALIVARDLVVGRKVGKTTSHYLPTPAEFILPLSFFGLLSLLGTNASVLTAALGWGVVVATALNIGPGAPLGVALGPGAHPGTAAGNVGKVPALKNLSGIPGGKKS